MIKLGFSDFWPEFEYENFYLYEILKSNFPITLSDEPDFLIYSEFSNSHLDHDCVKIKYSAENTRPDFSVADFALGFDYLSSPKHLRLPLYVNYFDKEYTLEKLLRIKTEQELDRIVNEKEKFCCFVASNDKALERINFFNKLSEYKKVDSGGATLNNVGGQVENKLEFVKSYKFTIAFENESYPGYTTEKVLQPFHVDTIPIYWGNPVVHEEFNCKSFINCHEYPSESAVIDEIIKLDNDQELYRKYLSECLFYENEPNLYFSRKRIVNFFERIFSEKTTQVTQQKRNKKKLSTNLSLKKQKLFYRINKIISKN